MTPLADLARAMFAAAVDAVQPGSLMGRLHFDEEGVRFGNYAVRPPGRLLLVALGKAAPGLAEAFLTACRRRPDTVFVLAPHGVPAPEAVAPFTRRGRHPIPDEEGEASCAELLDLVAGTTPQDGVVLLLSGGTSALLAKPLAGVTREQVAEVSRALMAAGAPIGELNTVRKHLLAAAGGRLAAGCPAPLLTLIISDVPGDDTATIASGPTTADPTTFGHALEVIERRRVAAAHPEVTAFLESGARGEVPESPKPGSPFLDHSRNAVLGSSREALAAAGAVARQAGLTPVILTRTYGGEARELGRVLGSLALAFPAGEGAAVLAAGETTVTVTGEGRGGRNLEAALAAAVVLAGNAERAVLVGGTDGVDGSASAAGAVVDGSTIHRAAARNRFPEEALERNNSWGFFEGLPDAIVTGPTGTNVADVAFVLAAGQPSAGLSVQHRAAVLGEPSPPPVARPRHRD